jgi:hypothetical protein
MVSLAGLVLSFALPAFAQTSDPPADPPTTPAPAAPKAKSEPSDEASRSMKDRFFFGGGVGAAFGDVDYFEIAPLVGFQVVPRLDLGLQPFYRWTNDGRYSPSIESTDYGARLFARVRIIAGFFAEADYQYTSYEYVNVTGGTTRDTNNGFLAGAGYTVPLGGPVGMYFSALYDFSYDDSNPYNPYDSPVQFQIGVAVGF